MQQDKELVKQALEGSEIAYEKLMERYYDSIYVMVLQLVKNMTDAQEIAQDTFTKAFSKLLQYNEQYAFSSWLFGIASNASIDFLRKKKYIEISFDDEDKDLKNAEASESPTPNPEEHLIQKQSLKALRAKIEDLKEHYRKLLELRYFEEYTYEEISEELSLPMGTVKTQLHRAKNQLMKSIKEQR
ncbi:RNA polymerase sigma-70 factor (ECF subfamily) [Balneicella halophila]|uniref:RNA polymerase sigma-70 factor (ECF subfamily) n=1 Tax=Balneicella halophila TaxID=1537566 RepID=A0A7L4URH0_BALHA|nr:sigma-70 family RNA polymerase sigma factor [Balneicella halophila]PVX50919.1 RNA polymerase sigma-70 factor (ECF subfamily) [Balneicella halophila]